MNDITNDIVLLIRNASDPDYLEACFTEALAQCDGDSARALEICKEIEEANSPKA